MKVNTHLEARDHTKDGLLSRAGFCALLFFSLSHGLHATEYCVTNSVEFRQALTSASTNSQNNIIRMQSGNYPTGGNFFEYSGNNFDLQVIGGYDADAGTPGCSTKLKGAQWTTIDGAGVGRLLEITSSAAGSTLALSDLTLTGGVSNSIAAVIVMATPQLPPGSTPQQGRLKATNVIVRGNMASSLLFVMFGGANVTLDNSLIVENQVLGGAGYGVRIGASVSVSDAIPLHMVNNTIANNVVPAAPLAGAMISAVINSSPQTGSAVHNNIIWNNSGTDINFSGTGKPTLVNNDIGSIKNDATITLVEISPFNVVPTFASAHNYRLTYQSPLVDGGILPLSPDQGEYDVEGNDRFVGASDVGAYELQDTLFSSGFELP